MTCYNITEKSGALTGISAVDDNDDLMLITDGGTIIRTPVAGIPTRSRSAGGVIIMKMADGQKIANFTKVAHAEESEESEEGEENEPDATAEAPETDATEPVDVTDAGAVGEQTEEEHE